MKEVAIGEVCELINGRAFKPSDWGTEGLPIVRIQNLNNEEAPFNRYDGEVRDRFLIDSGALLFSWSGTPGTSFGAFFWHRGPAILNQHIFHVLPKNGIDKNYLRHALNGRIERIIAQAHGGVGLQHITKDKLEATTIPLPSPDRQRHIADLLDKADAIRKKRKETVALTEELLRSAFLEMFGDPVANPKGWPMKTLGELLDAIDSGWSPVCEARPARDGQWGVLKLGAVTFGRYDQHENKALGADLAPVPELEVKAGDVLFSRKNTYEHVAACVFVTSTRPKLLLPDLIFRFALSKTSGLRGETLWGLLSNERMRKRVQGLACGTAGSMPNISKERLKRVSLPVPPLALQGRFAALLTQSEDARAALERASTESDTLFNSFVARTFSGSLEAPC